ncbi:MAG: TetR/AcrR family transcriptional regulator [Minwuia sp.]|uniref:TetR/AcrR family transcriptional regulator n=1 Tax=Minwuia sp. TaxID=2493630 RepID=UPI003A88E9AA
MAASAAEKRSYVRMPREARMREIESAARTVFAQHGFNDAPISEIARRAGVSEGAIYKFYANKRELLHTILAAWYRGMIDDFIAKLEGVEGTRARLHVVIWQHLKSIRENPDLCRLFYSEVRSAPDYYATELYRINRDYTRVLLEILQTGMALGDIRADISPPLVRDVIFGGIEHRVTGYLAERGSFDHEAVAAQLSEMVFAGIAARPPATSGLAAVVSRLETVADRLDTAARGDTA